MRKWWIGYTGPNETVQEVEVIGQRNPAFGGGMSVIKLAEGIIEDAATSSLYDTEAGARRARVLSEAEDLDGEARGFDASAERCQDEADRKLALVAEYKAKAAELRARAKGLRDALAESQDWPTVEAVEGRR